MTAIDRLRGADTLRLTGVSYHLSAPVVGDSDHASPPFCVAKPVGQLAFTLTSEELKLPVGGLQIPFKGTASGNTVTWKADQGLDVWFSGAHITHVSGQILTRVDDQPAALGSACSGDERVVRTTLTTIGDSNTLTISTSLGDATVSKIGTFGWSAETLAPVFFGVRIHANVSPHNECGQYYQIQGSTVVFTAAVVNLQAPDPITDTTFKWTVPAGLTALGSTDQATISVLLPGHGAFTLRCDAVVSTAVESAANHGVASFAVLTADEVVLMNMLCRLRQESLPRPAVVLRGVGPGFTAGGIRFVDPLWDPAPDDLRDRWSVLMRPYSLRELAQIHAAATQIAQIAPALMKQTAVVMERQSAENKVVFSKHQRSPS